jgi:hypothetical protein
VTVWHLSRPEFIQFKNSTVRYFIVRVLKKCTNQVPPPISALLTLPLPNRKCTRDNLILTQHVHDYNWCGLSMSSFLTSSCLTVTWLYYPCVQQGVDKRLPQLLACFAVPFSYYRPIYNQVYQAISLFEILRPNFCMHFSFSTTLITHTALPYHSSNIPSTTRSTKQSLWDFATEFLYAFLIFHHANYTYSFGERYKVPPYAVSSPVSKQSPRDVFSPSTGQNKKTGKLIFSI